VLDGRLPRWAGRRRGPSAIPDLPIAVIPHPFGIRTREEVRQIAAQCVEALVKLVSGDAAK